MPKITWKISPTEEITAEVKTGMTLMEAAVSNNVPRVIGECGGNMACATCHVVVADECYDLVGEPNDIEDDMLDFTEAERTQNSRLSCQIRVTDELDGLVLTVLDY
ncbi:MAG: 2Fe-2S iron-sulfur cluster-binding protein [Paracoccaceae bacterium]|nr:2Fe-2S iron-sulfur cluster-binding protein [Paracoccaceae bacterium]MDE2737944.1 2Fe-2S iron-sulfur cluster-binding protein [Paracoccaceae bacterium]MDE2759062.1 2Fe-2S iron-sulfur cluster-binding protein [Paracoccaceae bacterium]MDE2916138.1 2Fe-2S iron-sulfur cluster-binding protein [Paracoccaceae bacterium]MYE36375.1 2Fe-2S iron-sulfur cluster binding domain-containing protein [Paracoccaceae bacterium]